MRNTSASFTPNVSTLEGSTIHSSDSVCIASFSLQFYPPPSVQSAAGVCFCWRQPCCASLPAVSSSAYFHCTRRWTVTASICTLCSLQWQTPADWTAGRKEQNEETKWRDTVEQNKTQKWNKSSCGSGQFPFEKRKCEQLQLLHNSWTEHP